ncbi:carbohydrate kinase [Sphingomonas sp. HITSZ_GF]|uniref:FGGY-family carbohydrate kinase n=1 Tax=Sphingomonas sp. HITSZ_GF TaxID=3037247 RepID=UPI00240E6C39|nr:carbohydrate kinase [Sphingomonas sp. HITSZ_GF]MDG2532128.1 carbohydrate kinase [Sphingomonas sp. HITSZ_GF]
MGEGLSVVLDLGKTLSKLSLWDASGAMLARRTRPNGQVEAVLGGEAIRVLDTAGIEAWVEEVLREFAGLGRVMRIIPVGHGAAAAVVRDGALAAPPLDYEQPIPAACVAAYLAQRDPFARTGSPALPDGLNLGAQLHYLETLVPEALAGDALILPWPQYWAWRLSGVAASEVTSLGCHSDLWCPATGEPSALAVRRGWADRLAPLHSAGDAIGTLDAEWVRRTGLPEDVAVHCGLHDSNAALLAARGFAAIAEQEATVLSTGTWFVAMRTPGKGMRVDLAALPEARDCLVNVDVHGMPIPSARFMGGREIELLTGIDTRRIDINPDQPAIIAALPGVVASGAMVLPTLTPGVGPFPGGATRWINRPAESIELRAAVCLYAAMVADAMLDLIGTRERILVEGRFGEAQAFVRTLATLRPDLRVLVSNQHNDVSYGALRLVDPMLAPPSELVQVEPLDCDLTAYAARWRTLVAGSSEAA